MNIVSPVIDYSNNLLYYYWYPFWFYLLLWFFVICPHWVFNVVGLRNKNAKVELSNNRAVLFAVGPLRKPAVIGRWFAPWEEKRLIPILLLALFGDLLQFFFQLSDWISSVSFTFSTILNLRCIAIERSSESFYDVAFSNDMSNFTDSLTYWTTKPFFSFTTSCNIVWSCCSIDCGFSTKTSYSTVYGWGEPVPSSVVLSSGSFIEYPILTRPGIDLFVIT